MNRDNDSTKLTEEPSNKQDVDAQRERYRNAAIMERMKREMKRRQREVFRNQRCR